MSQDNQDPGLRDSSAGGKCIKGLWTRRGNKGKHHKLFWPYAKWAVFLCNIRSRWAGSCDLPGPTSVISAAVCIRPLGFVLAGDQEPFLGIQICSGGCPERTSRVQEANNTRSVLLRLQQQGTTPLSNPEVPCAAALPGASTLHPTGCQPARAHSQPGGMGSSCWQLKSVFGKTMALMCKQSAEKPDPLTACVISGQKLQRKKKLRVLFVYLV